jgi:hypothetical protein
LPLIKVRKNLQVVIDIIAQLEITDKTCANRKHVFFIA